MRYIMVTNNRKCYERWKDCHTVFYSEEWSYLDVLLKVRDYVQRGFCLLTHPMAGSLKPNQMPFKSILLGEDTMEDKEPFEDELLMESSIAAYHKFIHSRPLTKWPDSIRNDFRTVDLSLMEGVMNGPMVKNR